MKFFMTLGIYRRRLLALDEQFETIERVVPLLRDLIEVGACVLDGARL
jgi:hypothetical protein